MDLANRRAEKTGVEMIGRHGDGNHRRHVFPAYQISRLVNHAYEIAQWLECRLVEAEQTVNGTQIKTVPVKYENLAIENGFEGEGNIDLAPIFVDPDNGNYTLQEGSPCIDAGSSDPSYYDLCYPPSQGTSLNDMGAYGGPGACEWMEEDEPIVEVPIESNIASMTSST